MRLTVGGKLEVITGAVGAVHEGDEVIVGDVDDLVLSAINDGLGKLGRSGADGLELLPGENVNTHEMALCSTVLADLSLRHIDDLAGATLDHHCICKGSILAPQKVGTSSLGQGFTHGTCPS